MEADINGSQRKVLVSSVTPVRRTLGAEGIAVRDGKSLPFLVAREWSAPAGIYIERFYIVDPKNAARCCTRARRSSGRCGDCRV